MEKNDWSIVDLLDSFDGTRAANQEMIRSNDRFKATISGIAEFACPALWKLMNESPSAEIKRDFIFDWASDLTNWLAVIALVAVGIENVGPDSAAHNMPILAQAAVLGLFNKFLTNYVMQVGNELGKKIAPSKRNE